MPYVRTALGGSDGGMAEPPSSTTRQAATAWGPSRLSRSRAAGTSDTNVAPRRAAETTASSSKPGRTVSGVPVTMARVTTDSPPTWANGRQLSQ